MLKPIRSSAQILSRSQLFHPVREAYTPFTISFRRRLSPSRWDERSRRLFASFSARKEQATVSVDVSKSAEDALPPPTVSRALATNLPHSCPGCGAPSQTLDPASAGFYGSKRATRAVNKTAAQLEEEKIFQQALKSGALSAEALQDHPAAQDARVTPDIPICDRCHYLLYQSEGTGIIHPSMQSIQDIIEESPHKYNHIYHVIDAADFPMSLIPNLQNALKLPRLRTQNRRSKTITYLRGRTAEVSFIITRSDLLAPKEEQVNALVPYLREVLRDALGRSGHKVRLGNVRCVSAHRGWFTKTVKEDIWKRGGAGWMVGKVNVGKSALYEVVFPKGRNDVETNVKQMRNEERRALETDVAVLRDTAGVTDAAKGDVHADLAALRDAANTMRAAEEDLQTNTTFADSPGHLGEPSDIDKRTESVEGFQEIELDMNTFKDSENDTVFFDESDDASLLPPAQPETAYPRMPVVSSLPGTTASPIRIPFGNGKGELIDLPGIHRSSFDTFIKPEHRKDLVMRKRVVPEQYSIKPGQSILLGGVVRITPRTDELVFLACPFVPIDAHVTSTEKAIAIQTGAFPDGEPYTGTVESVATDDAKQIVQKAGTFQLEWDVTKRRAGPLTHKAAGKQKADNLPFVVYSADLLIESIGWVELVCQVRKRQRRFVTEGVHDAFGDERTSREVLPEVEVWTPEGKCIGIRRPMNAWLLGGPKKVAKHARKVRPRQSISFAKRKAGGAMNKQSLAE